MVRTIRMSWRCLARARKSMKSGPRARPRAFSPPAHSHRTKPRYVTRPAANAAGTCRSPPVAVLALAHQARSSTLDASVEGHASSLPVLRSLGTSDQGRMRSCLRSPRHRGSQGPCRPTKGFLPTSVPRVMATCSRARAISNRPCRHGRRDPITPQASLACRSGSSSNKPLALRRARSIARFGNEPWPQASTALPMPGASRKAKHLEVARSWTRRLSGSASLSRRLSRSFLQKAGASKPPFSRSSPRFMCACRPACPSRNGAVQRFSAAAGARLTRTGASAGHSRVAPDPFASPSKIAARRRPPLRSGPRWR